VIGVNLSAIDAVGGTNVIDVAALALVAYDADVGTNVIDVAALELTAYEADVAALALTTPNILAPEPLNAPEIE
jgi:hypothetical protein